MDRCDNVLCTTSFCYTCSPVTLPASWPSFRSLKTQFLSWAAQFNWTIFSFVKTSFTRPGLGHRKWVRRRNWRQNCSHPLVRCDQEHRWKPTENHRSVITSRLPCKRQSEKVPEIRIFLAHLLDPVLELCVVWCTGPGCDRQHRLEKFVKFFYGENLKSSHCSCVFLLSWWVEVPGFLEPGSAANFSLRLFCGEEIILRGKFLLYCTWCCLSKPPQRMENIGKC